MKKQYKAETEYMVAVFLKARALPLWRADVGRAVRLAVTWRRAGGPGRCRCAVAILAVPSGVGAAAL